MAVFHEFCYTGSSYTVFFPLLDSNGQGVTGQKTSITATIKTVGGSSFDTPDNSLDEVGSKGCYYLAVSQTEVGSTDGTIALCFEHSSYEDTWIFLHVVDEMPADATTVSDKTGYALSDSSWETMFNKTFLGKAFWRILVGWASVFFGKHLGANSTTPQWTDLSGNVILQLNSVDEYGTRGAISTDSMDDNDWWGTS